MANTTGYNQPLSQQHTIVKHNAVAASTTIPAGTLAVNDGGVAKVFTAALYRAGAKLLGFPITTVSNTSGSAVTYPDAKSYRRGTTMEVDGKSGDLPTIGDVGGLVAVSDNFSAAKTPVTNDLLVVLVEHASTNVNGKYVILLP